MSRAPSANSMVTKNPMLDEEELNKPTPEQAEISRKEKLLNVTVSIALIGIMVFLAILALSSDALEVSKAKREAIEQKFAPKPRPASVERGVFVHLFEWTWTDIEQECVNFLGPRGFSAVQVSPVNEHIEVTKVKEVDPQVGDFDPWWARYQPVSYKLESRSGTRQELEKMIKTCKEQGVDVYVDILFNHMAATNTGIGNAGTLFNSSSLEYEMYDESHFNSCDPESIQDDDWKNNATRVRLCRLVGLPDLDQTQDYVKETLIEHAIDLMEIGVGGLRLDAGKHMYPEDVNALLDGFKQFNPYIFSEIIDFGGEAVDINEYVPFYDVTEFKFEGFINNRFKYANLKDLDSVGQGMVPSDKAVVFTDNHDSQRNPSHITYKDEKTYELANVYMLAQPYGYPKLMSSFFFGAGEKDKGPPGVNGVTSKVYSGDKDNCGVEGQWVCEHRNNRVNNMISFRNFINENNASEMKNYFTNEAQVAAFARANKEGEVFGFVAINKESFDFKHKYQTGLKEGNYCDILDKDVFIGVGEKCPGRKLFVNEKGEMEVTLKPNTALAIYF